MKIIALSFLLIFAAGSAYKGAETVKEKRKLSSREKVMEVASSQLGIREKTGKNDGEVEKYIAHVGLDPKARLPYCAAFVSWVGHKALGSASPFPKSAWSPTHLSGSKRLTTSTEVKAGSVFGIYEQRRNRVIHVGFNQGKTGKYIITVEANTSPSAAFGSDQDRDGHGVYRKRRLINSRLRYKDHIKD